MATNDVIDKNDPTFGNHYVKFRGNGGENTFVKKLTGGVSGPTPNWLFTITLGWSDQIKDKLRFLDNTPNDTFICIKADLPKYQQTIKTVKFFGTEKSFAVNRKLAGDTTIEFWIREATQYGTGNGSNGNMADLNMLKLFIPEFNVDDFEHHEFEDFVDYIMLEVRSSLNKIQAIYRLNHPTLTNFEFSDSLSYEGDTGLKGVATIHYDSWERIA